MKMEKRDIRLAVVGSRTFTDRKLCWKMLDDLQTKYNIIEIISGGARGADSYGEAYADYHHIKKTIFPAEWDKYGKKAGYLRNIDIIKNCDVCIAFWDGESRGTSHDLDLCVKYNKICYVYNFITKEYYEY